MGNLGTDAYDSHFPGLASPVLVSGVANGFRVSSGSVERRVDLIEVLEKATVSSFDHLLPSDVDGPAARQIKQLHTEILMLRRELLGKGVHSSPNSAVEVAQAAARTAITIWIRMVSLEKLMVIILWWCHGCKLIAGDVLFVPCICNQLQGHWETSCRIKAIFWHIALVKTESH